MASDLPATMKAWVFSSRGSPKTVLKLSTYPTPKAPTGSKVLIRVQYCALNSLGPLLMTLVPSIFGTAWTALEFDVAGIVVAAGPDAPAAISTPGTAVWGCKDIAPVLGDHSGTLAEYVLADSALIKPLPKGMSAREAAGLGLVGGTACQLYDNASVSAGGRVLINGASGGVGSMAVQIGKAIGLHVTTTCSGSNADAVKKLGADEVIDYRTVEPSLPAYLKDACRDRPFDAILDCVGVQELYQASPAYLKPDGKVICVGAMGGVWAHGKNFCRNTLVPVFLGGTPRKWVFFSHKPSDNTMEQLKHYSDEGKLRCLVDSEYEMENALEAYERLESQRARGKILIKVS